MQKLLRPLNAETRVLNEKEGLVEYVASDETLDHYREIIRAAGWRFNFFARNPVFVDSHEYGSIAQALGKIVEFSVKGRKLVEVAKWAIDVKENALAQLGFRMTAAGYLPAVSVGFFPVRAVNRWATPDELANAAREMGLPDDVAKNANVIFLEQEQIELSACVIGANPSALARAYKAGAATDEDIEFVARTLSETKRSLETARAADEAAAAARAEEQRRNAEWLRKFEQTVTSI